MHRANPDIRAPDAIKIIATSQPCTPQAFADLRAVLVKPDHRTHPVAEAALSAATREEHQRVLALIGKAPLQYDGWNLPEALLEILSQEKRARNWKWSTISKKSASLQAACRLLPLYKQCAPVLLHQYPVWSQGLKTWARKSKEESPRSVYAATVQDIDRAISLTTDKAVQSLLAVSWLCCARIGDVLQLTHTDVKWSSPLLTVTHRKGKTIAARGPYSLHTTVPQKWRELIHYTMSTQTGKLWPSMSTTIALKALRAANTQMECRSIRRGALQCMANAGTDEETLRLFSGHTSVAMLRRYLAWGAIGSAKITTMTSAASVLGGGYREERRPHFIKCLGSEAPSSTEFFRLAGKSNYRDRRANGLPLHSKPVTGSVDLQRVRTWPLPMDLKRLVTNNLRWLDDPSIYYEYLSSGTARSQSKLRYSPKDLDILLRTGKIRVACPPLAFGGARGFTVIEAEKHRRRPIYEPYVNDLFRRVPTVRFMSAEQRHKILAKGKYAAAFDFSAWYDQLGIDPQIGAFLAANQGSKWFAPTTLPMGFRPSCATAQSVTWAIVHGIEAGTTCRVITYIDNVIIVGADKSEVRRVAERFVSRAREAKAVLNDEHIHIQTCLDILGERVDLAAGTRTLTAKTRDKVSVVDKYLTARVPLKTAPTFAKDQQTPLIDLQMSRRELAATVGVLLFASRVLSVHLSHHYWPLRIWRETMGSTHWDEWASDLPPIPTATAREFITWARRVLEAKPAPLTNPPSAPGLALFVDASASGWGMVAVRDGGTLCAGHRWPDPIDSSVVAEPLATWAAICRAVKPGDKSITIFTDHLPLVYAGNRGYAKCFTYNTLLQRIQSVFPALSFRFEHIAGINNPSDEPSRGKKVDQTKLQTALRELNSITIKKQNSENGEDGPEWKATALNPLKSLSEKKQFG